MYCAITMRASLKTPLTVITTCLSVLEMETGKNKWIDKIQAQIRQLCSILLDNAVKHALDTAPVMIGLKKEKAGVVLRCSNACAVLPQEELNKLFDRFYRPDKSRSSETGGFGIGLSIARSIAQAHKGTIKAAAPQPGIIEFTAVLK